MESLGGDQMWWDRFLAQHSAIFYFWVLILFYTFAPRMAYVFSELVEVSHHHIHTSFVMWLPVGRGEQILRTW